MFIVIVYSLDEEPCGNIDLTINEIHPCFSSLAIEYLLFGKSLNLEKAPCIFIKEQDIRHLWWEYFDEKQLWNIANSLFGHVKYTCEISSLHKADFSKKDILANSVFELTKDAYCSPSRVSYRCLLWVPTAVKYGEFTTLVKLISQPVS